MTVPHQRKHQLPRAVAIQTELIDARWRLMALGNQLSVLSPPSDLAAIEKALAIVKVAIADLEESF